MTGEEAQYWLLTAAAVAVAVAAWFLLPIHAWLHDFAAWAGGFGLRGLDVVALIFVAATLIVVPGTPLTIAGAVAFRWWSIPVVLAAATLGSWLAFGIGRTWLRERVRGLVERRPGLRATVEAVGDGDWRLLTLRRLSPIVPFNALNFALAVTGVRAGAFLASTVIGMCFPALSCASISEWSDARRAATSRRTGFRLAWASPRSGGHVNRFAAA